MSGTRYNPGALLVRMPPELHAEVKRAAKDADLSMAQWIRRALREALQAAS